ncbi:MAG TPA: sugar ABC transporter ATP-binding protein [Candidatus Dormibacteraeota bacterium]|jgi:ABC-type sugar transport system ATPase subunit
MEEAAHDDQIEASGPPFLRVIGVRKSFDGVHALHGVDLDCLEGEVHALVGENGAGKSTLIHVMTGVHRPDSGSILIRGAERHFRQPSEAEQAGISAVYQELSLIDDLDVAENILLHREPRRWGPLLNRNRLYDDCRALLKDLEIDVDVRAPVRSLSIARRQLVELARALSRSSSLVIMDEPTASLTIAEQEHLFTLLERLRKRRIAVLYVSHRLEEIFRIADRVTVLRDGAKVRTMRVSDTSKAELVELMVGRSLVHELYPQRKPLPAPSPGAKPALEVVSMNSPGRLQDVSLKVWPGEIVGLAGLIGSGRSSLLHSIFGADRDSRGSVLIAGREIRVKSPRQAIAAGMAMICEDRKLEGLAINLTNFANISVTFLNSRLGIFHVGKARSRAREAASRVALKARLVDPTRLLSGGNQQKVVLAKWIATKPSVLLCDEPTRGIDVGAKAEIYRFLRGLADEGVAVLFASSDLPEVLGLADRILVMSEGCLAGEFPDAQTATEDQIMFAAAGVEESDRKSEPA